VDGLIIDVVVWTPEQFAHLVNLRLTHSDHIGLRWEFETDQVELPCNAIVTCKTLLGKEEIDRLRAHWRENRTNPATGAEA